LLKVVEESSGGKRLSFLWQQGLRTQNKVKNPLRGPPI